MEKQITEVKNYFLNKITSCDFKIITLRNRGNGWHNFIVEIDDLYQFDFSINKNSELYCQHSGSFMQIEIPNDRLNNLIKFIEDNEIEAKKRKIAELEKQLEILKS